MALCARPAQALNIVQVPGVVRWVKMCVLVAVQCGAHFVFEARDLCCGSGIL